MFPNFCKNENEEETPLEQRSSDDRDLERKGGMS